MAELCGGQGGRYGCMIVSVATGLIFHDDYLNPAYHDL